MIGLAILLLIVILILLLVFKSNTSQRLQRMESEMTELKKLLSQRPAEPVVKPVEKPVEEVRSIVPKPEQEENKYWKSGFEITKETTPSFKKEQWLQKEKDLEEKPAFSQPGTPQLKEDPITSSLAVFPLQPPFSAPPRKPTFFESNPDLEKFIGENLVSKIGIAILVLAIGYFVKYAIDNEWIGTIGRVAVGVVCGGILIGIAHRLRAGYHAFSSVLAGGGLAVLYFTITLAHQQYQLFGSGSSAQTIAFIIMLVITVFAALLALLYNRQELAVIALTGGFAAPFLISTGSGNYITLFIYLIVLNTGLLLIAYRKAWRILNTTAFVFTVILFASWLYSLPDAAKASVYANGFLFATIFYLLFLVINIANNIKENKHFIAFDFSILLANTGLFFSAGLYCLHGMNAGEYNGLFSAAMGVFNLALSYFLFRKQSLDKNILYLLISITLTFVSLTAPLQLQGHFITLFWASEAVLLGWLYLKSKIGIIQYAALIIYVCMLLSLLGDWNNVYYTINDRSSATSLLSIIINRGFITGIYAAAASYLLYFLLRKNNSRLLFVNASFFRFAALIILFLAGNIEISYQFGYYYPTAHIAALYMQLYSFAFILILLFINQKIKGPVISQKQQVILLTGCIVVYFLMLSITSDSLHQVLSDNGKHTLSLFTAHWLVAVLTAAVLYKLILMITSLTSEQKERLTWLASLAVVVFLSAEVYFITLQLFYTNEQSEEVVNRVFIKAVLPVLWGLCSFAMMWLGMKYKYKTLRVVSLSLFSLTLLKLFAYDISNIPVAGKIIAFFCLGVLLLIISFMYQRLKKIIIEDEKEPVA